MKKLLSFVLVGVLLISGLGAVGASESTTKHEQKTIVFSHLLMQEKNDGLIPTLEGANTMFLKQDYYMVPTRIETFTFPFGTIIQDVVCVPRGLTQQSIEKDLLVTPVPVLLGQETSLDITQRTEPVVSEKNWYHYTVGTGLLDNHQRGVIVTVQIFPVQYDSMQKMVTWASSVDVQIEYVLPTEKPISFENEYTFIVLASASYVTALTPLIDHKINFRQIPTKLVSLDDIYNGVYFPAEGRDNQEKIKFFIKNAIEQWNTSSVLLVGGSSAFPTRPTHIHIDATPPDNEVFVSDLYYADIYNQTSGFCSWDSNGNDVFAEYNWSVSRLYDEVDLYPDVSLGRLACTNTNQVNTVVNKIITYETTSAYTAEWFTNLVTIGGDSFPGDENQINEGEFVNEAVIGNMSGFVPDRVWASNGRLSGVFPSGVTEISNAINAGCGFVDFSGHGNPQVWATHPHENPSIWLPTPTGSYTNSHVGNLQNGEELPIVIIGACSVSKYNQDANCFGWSFLSNANGGAIATCGATALGWAYLGEWVTYALIEGIAIKTFQSYWEKRPLTFGEMWAIGLSKYIRPEMDALDYKTLEEWQPFGDPTLLIAGESDPPAKPSTPFGPTTGKSNVKYTYTTSTTDPNGQMYYLFDWGDGTTSDWIGPYESGVEASADHAWQKPGEYQIKAKAKGRFGAQSDWSDPLTVEMSAPDISIEITGGLFTVKAILKNNRTTDITNVKWTVTVTGGMFSNINKTSFGTILTLNPDASETVPSLGIIGLGKIEIIVTVEADGIEKITMPANGFVFLIYLMIQ